MSEIVKSERVKSMDIESRLQALEARVAEIEEQDARPICGACHEGRMNVKTVRPLGAGDSVPEGKISERGLFGGLGSKERVLCCDKCGNEYAD